MFTVDQEELKTALGIAGLAVGSETGSHVTKFKFEVSPKKALIHSTDDNEWVFVPFEAEVEETAEFMISADRVQKWVKNVPSGPIEVEQDGTDIVMRQDDIVGRFVRFDAANFPQLKNKTEEAEPILDVPSDRFGDAFGFSQFQLDDVDDNTSNRAWKQIAELWDGQVITSNVKSVTCYIDDQLAGEPIEVDEQTKDEILSRVDTHDEFSTTDVFADDERTEVYPNTAGKVIKETGPLPDDNELRPLLENHLLDQFRVTKDVLSDLLSFLRKTGGVGVEISRNEGSFSFKTDDGSVFGFHLSNIDMPYFAAVMYEEPVEDHRWEMNSDKFLSAVKALTATAPTNAFDLLLEFSERSGEDVLELRMPSEAGDEDSVYPVPVEIIEGCKGQQLRVGYERVSTVVGQYSGDDIEFALDTEEDYLKVADYTDDEQEGEPEPVKFSQIPLQVN